MRKLFRQRRAFDVEQITGFLMLGGGLALALNPITISMAWLAILWDFPALPTLLMLAFLVFGFVLALQQRSASFQFALLTLPILLYGVILLAYSLIFDFSVFTAGMFGAFWIFMQYAHAQQAEVRAWIKP